MLNRGSIVICKIVKIEQSSVVVELIEHNNREGFIHISEVANGWVKNIKNHVKQGDIVVAKVFQIRNNHVILSLKRVTSSQKSEKLREYKFEQKAKKMLTACAKTLKKHSTAKIEEALKNQFGSIYDAFKTALDNPDKLEVPKEWQDAIHSIAEKNIEKKIYEIRKRVKIYSYESDGVDKIKSVFKCIEKNGLEIKYISSPIYLVSFSTLKPKKDKDKIDMILKKCSIPNVKTEVSEN